MISFGIAPRWRWKTRGAHDMQKITSTPKISVCMPVFNGEKFLQQAIESILTQSYGNFELIIADDCSTDESRSIINSFASRDKRIRTIFNERNIGLFPNYNQCLEAASGQLIKLFAQDDLLHKECLSKCIAAFRAHPEVVLVSVKRVCIDAEGSTVNEAPISPGEYLSETQNVLGRTVMEESLPSLVNFIGEPSTVMFHASATDEGFDVRYHHLGDLEFWFRILQSGRYTFVNETLCSFRVHESSTTSLNQKMLLHGLDLFRLAKQYGSFASDGGLSNTEFEDTLLQVIFDNTDWNKTREFLLEDTKLSEKEQQMFASISAQEYFELAVRALARMGSGSRMSKDFKRRTTIIELEKKLHLMLSSQSWKVTKCLRDINSTIFDSPMQTYEPWPTSSDSAKLRERNLRQTIAKIRKSRSWQITAPLRVIERLLQKPAQKDQKDQKSPQEQKRKKTQMSFDPSQWANERQ
jgi:glycosyltransferase involved in cell wall biosynthesis